MALASGPIALVLKVQALALALRVEALALSTSLVIVISVTAGKVFSSFLWNIYKSCMLESVCFVISSLVLQCCCLFKDHYGAICIWQYM